MVLRLGLFPGMILDPPSFPGSFGAPPGNSGYRSLFYPELRRYFLPILRKGIFSTPVSGFSSRSPDSPIHLLFFPCPAVILVGPAPHNVFHCVLNQGADGPSALGACLDFSDGFSSYVEVNPVANPLRLPRRSPMVPPILHHASHSWCGGCVFFNFRTGGIVLVATPLRPLFFVIHFFFLKCFGGRPPPEIAGFFFPTFDIPLFFLPYSLERCTIT